MKTKKLRIGERVLPTDEVESLEARLNFIHDLFEDNEIKQGIDEFSELVEDVERFVHGGGKR